jgi:murein DD-endopeptidase MepM/ murein hydrolase activator NlpD
METTSLKLLLADLKAFFLSLSRWLRQKTLKSFWWFEKVKSLFALILYRQRGRWARPFIHSGMAFLIVGGITLGPTLVAENFPGSTTDLWQESPSASVLSAATAAETGTTTLISDKARAEIVDYTVQPGDTVSTIADKFGISTDTIRWENNLASIEDIKPGQTLRILPVTGIAHKVSHGETIYSIAKRYDVGPQGIVDWPYNTFTNDETFALAVGQILIVPDGVMPKAQPWQPREYLAEVPQAGTVTGTGQFVWPVGGNLSQGFSWYHKGIDISNKAAPRIVAADGGTVIVVGWPSPWDYGNRVLIDHGNGYATLYAHLSQIYVSLGQKVSQGQVIGQMGSTGRSTGTHLHFEIRKDGAQVNPLNYLR